ncbi:MAG: ORF6N domain-containing protein [Candidatus Omnitrophica bacterium]|nr:ORF6N domain-containing protein [Candidatus Omnitrophota bacterium]
MKELIPQEVVERRIFVIRGQKVMLSTHLAELYGVETRILIQAVKRNIERFPEDFMLKLSRKEIMRISQFVISLKYSKSVYAFTEHGILMLSSVLNSERAIQVNIAIMRAFVRLKQVLATHKELARKLKELEGEVGKHNKLIIEIFKIIKQLTPALIPPLKPKPPIGFIKYDD